VSTPTQSARGRTKGFVAAIVTLVAVLLVATPTAAQAQAASRNLAPGFKGPEKGARMVITPLDVELFSMSAGGVLEPKADWTDSAQRHMKSALEAKARSWGLEAQDLDTAKADEMAEMLNLYAAVARSIAVHHMGAFKLPTKDDKLDWSFGDTLRPLQQATGARYALFTWVRDSYASAERKAMMVGLALLGVGVSGGIQVGYASLVDLETGQVVWFNQLQRASGDLREAGPAAETMGVLLNGFPEAK
jgi:hypothetical protein